MEPIMGSSFVSPFTAFNIPMIDIIRQIRSNKPPTIPKITPIIGIFAKIQISAVKITSIIASIRP